MKKFKTLAGAKKLLALGLVLAYMCMATACTNGNNISESDSGAESGALANNTGTNGNGTNGIGNNGSDNNVTTGIDNNGSENNGTDGSYNNSVTEGTDDNSLMGDSDGILNNVIDDVRDGIDNIADDTLGDNTSANNGTNGTGVNGGTAGRSMNR